MSSKPRVPLLLVPFGLCALAGAALGQEKVRSPGPSFTRRADSFPLDSRGTRVALGDLDGDGFPDALIDGILYLNDQEGAFTLAPARAGLRGRALAAAMADYDRDGDLDVFLSGFTGQPDRLMRNDTTVAGRVAFTDVTAAVCPILSDPNPGEGLAWGDLDGDGCPDLMVANYEVSGRGTPDRLFLSDGVGGLRDLSSLVSTADARPGRGASMVDFDQDGDLDVYVSNYRLEPNYHWINRLRETGAFTLRGEDRGLTYLRAHTLGSEWGDLDGDGDVDMVMGNLSHPGQPMVQVGLQQAGRFTLTPGRDLGIAWEEAHLNPTLLDADDDGDLDLYLTTTYGRQGFLYQNRSREDGKLAFRDVTETSEAVTYDGWSSAVADVDLDGDQDLVVAKPGQAPILLRNTLREAYPKLRSVRLRLRGGRSDTWGSGATATLSGGGAPRLVRQLSFGHGTGSQSEPILHFGVGRAAGPFQVEVRWPSGAVERLTLGPGLHQVDELGTPGRTAGVPGSGSSPGSRSGIPIGSTVPGEVEPATPAPVAPAPAGAPWWMVWVSTPGDR